MQFIFNESLELVGRHGVGHDDRVRMSRREDRGHERDERIAVDLGSVRKDGCAAVAVAVKDDAEVRVGRKNGFADGCHRVFIFRIRDMVREMAVRLKIAAPGDVRAERDENAGGEEAGSAVAGVDRDAKAGKRLIVVGGLNFLLNDIHHVAAVEGYEVEGWECFSRSRRRLAGIVDFGRAF